MHSRCICNPAVGPTAVTLNHALSLSTDVFPSSAHEAQPTVEWTGRRWDAVQVGTDFSFYYNLIVIILFC